MVNYQLQFMRNRWAAPITRDYMLETEQRLRALDAEQETPLRQAAHG
jgi:hypothetical protein